MDLLLLISYNLSMTSFLTQTMLFILTSLLCLILPGNLIWQKAKLKGNFWEEFIFSLNIGFVTFTLLSYVLLYFRTDWFIIPLTVLTTFIWLRYNYTYFFKIKLLKVVSIKIDRHFLLGLLIFGIGIIGQLAVISPSGIYSNGDLVFWSSHGHDASWHIALIEEIKKGGPWQNPVYAGEKLVNYHFFSDISLAIYNKFFGLNLVDLYFRFFPLVYSLLLGGTIFYLTKTLVNSFTAGLWAAFFTYFTGSFGYFVTFFRNRTISGETTFGSSQVQSTIGNPPQITASIVLITFLYFFVLFLRKQNKYLFFLLILFASVLIVFKVYAGVILFGSLFLVGSWQFIRERKLSILSIATISAFFSALLYLPNTSNSAAFLIWEPWWYIRTLIVYPNKLNWIDLELRRQTYFAEGNLKRVISIEAFSFLLFFFGNLGMRFLGLWAFTKFSLRIFNDYLYQLLTFVTVIAFIMPMLFLQKGVASNTIQFLHYFLLLFGIFAATTTVNLLSKIKIVLFRYIIIFLIIAFSIPTQTGLIMEFYSRGAPVAKIEREEFEALGFLKNNTEKNSIILTAPFDRYVNTHFPTPPIWAWSDSAYVSAFSARRVYLEDSEQVDIMGYNLKKRQDIQSNLFQSSDQSDNFVNTLKQLSINYLYFPKILKPKIDLNQTSLVKVFDNDKYEIWQLVI